MSICCLPRVEADHRQVMDGMPSKCINGRLDIVMISTSFNFTLLPSIIAPIPLHLAPSVALSLDLVLVLSARPHQ